MLSDLIMKLSQRPEKIDLLFYKNSEDKEILAHVFDIASISLAFLPKHFLEFYKSN